jgi:hypothetical protein
MFDLNVKIVNSVIPYVKQVVSDYPAYNSDSNFTGNEWEKFQYNITYNKIDPPIQVQFLYSFTSLS